MISQTNVLVDEPDCYLTVLTPKLKYKTYLKNAMSTIIGEVRLEYPNLKLYGKTVKQSRASKLFSDKKITYSYSGHTAVPEGLSNCMKGLMAFVNGHGLKKICPVFDTIRGELYEYLAGPENVYCADGVNYCSMNDWVYTYDSVMINRYIDNESIGWHADSTTDLNCNSPIMSIGYGSSVHFKWKPKKGGKIKDVLLAPGDILIMGGNFQKQFVHSLGALLSPIKFRYSFVFRCHYSGIREMKWPRVMPGRGIYENHRMFRLQIPTISFSKVSLAKIRGFYEKYIKYERSLYDMLDYKLPLEMRNEILSYLCDFQLYELDMAYEFRDFLFEYTP